MTQIRETVEIQATPEAVWALAGDPARIHEFVPAIATSTAEGDQRSCTTVDGGEIQERILERSDEEHYYAYEITESPFPLKSYRSVLSVHGHDDHSHVNWEAEIEPEDPDAASELAENFSQLYRQSLETLREQIESARMG